MTHYGNVTPATCSDPLDFSGQLATARRVSDLRRGLTICGTDAQIDEAFRVYVALASAYQPKLEVVA